MSGPTAWRAELAEVHAAQRSGSPSAGRAILADMAIQEPSFVRDIRMQQMVDERVDLWMTQRIAPVLAYLRHCETDDDANFTTVEVRRLLVDGLS